MKDFGVRLWNVNFVAESGKVYGLLGDANERRVLLQLITGRTKAGTVSGDITLSGGYKWCISGAIHTIHPILFAAIQVTKKQSSSTPYIPCTYPKSSSCRQRHHAGLLRQHHLRTRQVALHTRSDTHTLIHSYTPNPSFIPYHTLHALHSRPYIQGHDSLCDQDLNQELQG